MKRIALVLSFAFLISIPAISEAANPVAGGKCTKAGSTQTYQNKKFTCIKSGKKLVWSKGVSIPSATITPAPTQTSKQKTHAELIAEEFELTNRKAYEEIRSSLRGLSSSIPYQVIYTANFPKEIIPIWDAQAKTIASQLSQFLETKEEYKFYYVTELDRDWMLKQGIWSENNLPGQFKNWASVKQDYNHCEGAAAWYLKVGNPAKYNLYGGLAIPSWATATSTVKHCMNVILTHESFHAIQDYWLYGHSGPSHNQIRFNNQEDYDLHESPMFREGSTEAISFAFALDTYDKYLAGIKGRFANEARQAFNIPITKDEKSVEIYLKVMEARSNDEHAHDNSYSFGKLFYDYMIANYGFAKYVQLLKSDLQTQTFNQAFKNVYGISIDEAYSKASRYVWVGLQYLNVN